MPKSKNYKSRILYLLDYLMRNSDENNPISISKIIDYMDLKNIPVDRKTIYDDIEVLQTYGYDVEHKKGPKGGYYIASRLFELSELKMLVDAVSSAKFIATNKSSKIIKKLSSLCSIFDEKELVRKTYAINKSKFLNESVFYSIDAIHKAISENKCISFSYFQWHINYSQSNNIVMTEKHSDHHIYNVSPFDLLWDDEQYYLVGYDNDEQIIKHFRVDKMKNTTINSNSISSDVLLKRPDIEMYSNRIFGMFGGNEEKVKLRFDSALIGIVADRFGSDYYISKCDDNKFDISVNVVVSPQFFSYIFAFSDKVQILSPSSVVEKYKQHIQQTLNLYN